MHPRGTYPCNYEKACYCLWAVKEQGWTQTKAAIVLELNVGTVNHVINKRRHRRAKPVPIPGYPH